MGLTYDRTISTDADAYSMGGFPAGVEANLYVPNDGDASIGTSGADTPNITITMELFTLGWKVMMLLQKLQVEM